MVWELHCDTGGPIADLEVRRPTLEDTYLHMENTRNRHPADSGGREDSAA